LLNITPYYVGIINRKLVAGQIESFNPQGFSGRPHLQTLPWRVVSPFS